MEIKSVTHKGLRRLMEDGVAWRLPGGALAKIEAMLSFLLVAPDIEAVKKLRTWKAHQLAGDRRGTWSLTVTRNWRITFDVIEGENREPGF